MRILYIVSELDKCGASLSFLTLLRGMRERGIEAFVVSPDWNLVDDNFVKTDSSINLNRYDFFDDKLAIIDGRKSTVQIINIKNGENYFTDLDTEFTLPENYRKNHNVDPE